VILLTVSPLLVAMGALLLGAVVGFAVGLHYGFDIWAIAVTVAIWGLLAPVIFWSASDG
jgi:hypothetical protein